MEIIDDINFENLNIKLISNGNSRPLKSGEIEQLDIGGIRIIIQPIEDQIDAIVGSKI